MKISNWYKWSERGCFGKINLPGIYIIAKTKKELNNKKFSLIKEIIYIGMTNSKGGLKARLKQFDNTIKGKLQHGGADRVRYKFPRYDSLSKELFVSMISFEADTKNPKVKDLLVMGEVAKCEYVKIAEYLEKFGKVPDFNDKSTYKFSKKIVKLIGVGKIARL